MPFNSQLFDFNGQWNAVAGVYGVMNAQQQMIYIGQTDDFQRRLAEHIADTTHCMHRYNPRYAFAEVIPQQQVRDVREAQLIAEYAPPCNQQPSRSGLALTNQNSSWRIRQGKP